MALIDIFYTGEGPPPRSAPGCLVGGNFCVMEVGWYMSLYVGFEEFSLKTASFMIFLFSGGEGALDPPLMQLGG